MLPEKELASLRSTFLGFAEETRGNSPLYEHLSLKIAENDGIVSMLALAAEHQRRPNLLFAAVHDLILGGTDHQLANYYPTVGGQRSPDHRTFDVFASFLQASNEEIVRRLRNRSTQTNEPGRCAALRAGLGRLTSHINRPVALVELGASAGLLLHLDRYRYCYGDEIVGPPDSPVAISPDVRGAVPSELDLPEIRQRVGVDLAPIDAQNSADRSWLKACVWPENIERFKRLEAALQVAATHPDVQLVSGDLVELLEPVIRSVDSSLLVCVIHSAAFAYLDEPTFHQIEAALDRLGGERDMARLAFEGPFIKPFVNQARSAGVSHDEESFLLGLTTWIAEERKDELLARAHPHGVWLEWLA